MVSDETLSSIRNLVEYLYHDEEKHSEECEKQGPHIFQDVKKVKEWLDGESDLPTIECPRCKENTLEIHGEGITSDDRHYPLEQCKNCDYPNAPCPSNKHGA